MKTNIFTYVQSSVHFFWCLVFVEAMWITLAHRNWNMFAICVFLRYFAAKILKKAF